MYTHDSSSGITELTQSFPFNQQIKRLNTSICKTSLKSESFTVITYGFTDCTHIPMFLCI